MEHRTARPPHLAVAVTVVGLVSCACLIGLLPGVTASRVSDVAQGVAAFVAAASAGWRARTCTDRRTGAAWVLIAAACLAWAAGEGYWCSYTLGSDDIPFPSLADAGFLTFAVLMVAALLVHPAPGGRVAWTQRLLDGAMTAGAVGLVSWLTVLSAVADAGDGSTGVEAALLLAYPSLDALLVVLAVLLLTRAGGTRTALHLVGAGVLALGVSDSSFAYLAATHLYDGGLIDLGWIGGFLLIALAGTCAQVPPSDDGLPVVDGPAEDLSAEVRAVSPSLLPYVPVLVALAAVTAVTLYSRPLTKVETLLSCGIVLTLLVRQYLAVRDNARLAHQLRAGERRLRHLAFHDAMTGLANRALFIDRLEHVLAGHTRDGRPVAVVFLDLDDFKAVNDGSGHAAGDELLVMVASRLAAATRAGDTVARLGGDEFAVLLADAAEPERTAGRIRAELTAPFVLATGEHLVAASIGVAAVAAGDPPLSADALLARADAAMYAAKRAGKETAVAEQWAPSHGLDVRWGLTSPA